jgi:hypothetical protein
MSMPAAAIDRRLAPVKSKLKLKCRSLRLGEGSVTRQKSAQIAATGVVRRLEVSTMTPRSPCWRHAAEGRLVGAIGIKQLSLYSEDRGCPAPTAARILDIFHGLAGHDLLDQHGRPVLSFAPQLNELQQLVLDLLEIPHRIYTG